LPGSLASDIIRPLQGGTIGSCEAETELMLLDFGWSELLLIGIVALVFIGPKDLPKALRIAGFWVRKARSLSREFQSSIDQMIREAELDDVRQELKKASEIDIEHEFRRTIDPTGSLAEDLRPPELPDFSVREPTAEGDTPAASEKFAPPPSETAEPPAAAPIVVADDDVAYDSVLPKR
jgi:sec-independent protein translocase protein TatB